MNWLQKLDISARVIWCALFPPQNAYGRPDWSAAIAASLLPAGLTTVAAGEIPFCVADFSRSLNRQGELGLFFPGCLPLAAPFLLFRLKRTGFSRCRAWSASGGLALSACR
jgi:hypothetical protein